MCLLVFGMFVLIGFNELVCVEVVLLLIEGG